MNMRSVKNRPKPGSASISARSAAGRTTTSSTTSGTSSVNIREEVRLSASVSVMAPTCAGSDEGPGCCRTRLRTLVRARPRRLQHLVGPEVGGRRSRGGERVSSALVRPVEVLPGLPRAVGLLAAPAGVDQVLVGALERTEQLEPLEARGLLDGAGAAPEALLEAGLLLLGHRHG